MPVSLSNSKDIIANSISVIKGNKVIDVLETVDDIVGLAPATLDSLEKLANALDNNPTFYTNVAQAIDDKADASYVATQLATKANASDVATQLATKADQSTTYSKTEADTLLGSKANQSTTYSKLAVDTSLALKAPQSNTYTKTETNVIASAKQDIHCCPTAGIFDV